MDGPGDTDENPLTETEVHSFRSTVVRANYVALDRPDVAFATKDLRRRMSAPTRADVSALRRISGSAPFCVRVSVVIRGEFVDIDFAGCLAIRRSTFGGAAMRRLHLVKHWRWSQKAATPSSAGGIAVCGIVKSTTEVVGMQSVGRDLDRGPEYAHRLGFSCRDQQERAGIGRVRHLAVA